jgi:hypothetical protein
VNKLHYNKQKLILGGSRFFLVDFADKIFLLYKVLYSLARLFIDDTAFLGALAQIHISELD